MIHRSTSAAFDDAKRGITLLEVIISLGILSVGLASVVALIPAGGSQAKKAIIEDRRGAMAAAAMADVVTRGMLDQARWVSPVPSPPFLILIDPLGGGGSLTSKLKLVTITGLTATTVADEVFRSTDDLVYTLPDNGDDPALPKFFGNSAKRASEGNFSWLATLVPVSSGGPFYRLSIVEFHRRPLPQTLADRFTVPLDPAKPADPLDPAKPADRFLEFPIVPAMAADEFRALFPAGSVVLCTDANNVFCEWRRIVMASPTRTGTGATETITRVELTVDRNIPANVTDVFVIAGAVGLAERAVRLEEMSPWSQ